jgi:hypothetical protein
MLKNARKVEKEVGKPILKSLEDAGHIPNPFLDQIEKSVLEKVDAFSRKLDGPFTREFGRKYHEVRAKAWEQAKRKERDNPFGNVYTNVRGVNFALPEDAMMRHHERSLTHYPQGGIKINLVKPVMNWYNNNAYESSRIYSGLETGRVSTSVELLEYETTFQSDDGRVYNNELDELKYIYRAYWYLSGINRRTWIRTLYSDPETKILDFRTSQITPPDGLRRHDHTVLFVIEGTDVYVHVEDLYRWIQYYRIPRKKYAIGECESELCVQYAIYLEYMYGIPEEIIQERLTVSLVEDVRSHMEMLNLAVSPSSKKKEVDDEDDEYARRMLGVDTTFSFEKAERGAVEAAEAVWKMIPVSFKDGIIDLSQLDDGETDSYISDDDYNAENEIEQKEEWNLPYDPNLHADSNEYEALFRGLKRKDEDNIDYDNESVHSDDIPDKVLNPIEELGIDLIDPSRDTTDQPTIRRIGLAWDPGGGGRALPRRFVRNRRGNL